MAEGHDWLERQEGPDGQFCELLTRYPYDIAQRIEAFCELNRSPSDQANFVLRVSAWECRVKNVFTGDESSDVGVGDPVVIIPWRTRAAELWLAWKKEAFPGPKGSTRKRVRSTPTGSPESSSAEPG